MLLRRMNGLIIKIYTTTKPSMLTPFDESYASLSLGNYWGIAGIVKLRPRE